MLLATAPFITAEKAKAATKKALKASAEAAKSIATRRKEQMRAAEADGREYPTYQPKPHSVGWNTLMHFINADADDWLMAQDVCLKWGATPRNVAALLAPCVKAGYLISTREPQDAGHATNRYCAGPKLHIATALMHKRCPQEVPAKPAAQADATPKAK